VSPSISLAVSDWTTGCCHARLPSMQQSWCSGRQSGVYRHSARCLTAFLLPTPAGVLRAQRAQLQPAVAAQAAVQQHRQRLPAAGPPHPHQRALRGPPLAGAAAQGSQGSGVWPLGCTEMQRCRQSRPALLIESVRQTQLTYAAGRPVWWSCAGHGAGTCQMLATAAGTCDSHTCCEHVQHASQLAVTRLASLGVICITCACRLGR
jgi:hypothetical protein